MRTGACVQSGEGSLMHARRTQMKHWRLSGHRAMAAMNNFFRKEEVHSEASHLQDYVDDHPFLGERLSPSMSAAIKRCVDVPF